MARGAHAGRRRAGAAGAVPAPPLPATADELRLAGWHTAGYLAAVEWRFAAGSFAAAPATVWARPPRIPLLTGVEMTAEQRLLLLADSGGGIGMAVDLARWRAINVEPCGHLPSRPAARLAVPARAATAIVPGEGAVTETELLDDAGLAASAAQVLLVSRSG